MEPIGDFRAVIEAQIRPASTEAWEAAVIRSRAGGYIELGEVVEGTAYDFRFRWSRGMRLFPGAWVEELDHTIVGQTSRPAALDNFFVSPALEGFRVIWTNPETIDLAGAIVYTGTTTTFANASEAGRTSDNYFLATGLPADVALYVWARAVDFGGREGPLSGPLEVTPSAGAEGRDGVDGADGTGFEFVFRRTATGVAPGVPATTADERAMDDFLPADWSDNPQGPTQGLPYEWGDGSNRQHSVVGTVLTRVSVGAIRCRRRWGGVDFPAYGERCPASHSGYERRTAGDGRFPAGGLV